MEGDVTYVESIPPCQGCGKPAYSEVVVKLDGRPDFRVGDYCVHCQEALAAQQTILLRCSCGFEVESPGQGPLMLRAKNRMLRHLNKNMDCCLERVETNPAGEMHARPLAGRSPPEARQLEML